MKEYSRTQRLSSLIQRELALILQRELMNPSWGLMTISAVDLSPDLQQANIYLTTLGNTLTVDQVLESLNHKSGLLRHHLAQRLKTRVTPRLHFIYDESIEYASRLSALIDSVTPSVRDKNS